MSHERDDRIAAITDIVMRVLKDYAPDIGSTDRRDIAVAIMARLGSSATLPVGDDTPSLDAAWKAAEAALPEGDYDDESGHPSLVVETHYYVGQDHVEARAYLTPGYSDPVTATGPTPAAALLALAAATPRRTDS